MDDVYAINLAKTEFREGYNHGDLQRVMSVFADSLTEMSNGFPSFFGEEGNTVLRDRLRCRFEKYDTHVTVTVIDIAILGDTALEYGWHEFTATPRNGGEARRHRERYFDLWNRHADGSWKIVLIISNADREPRMADHEEALEGSVAGG